MWVGSAGAVKVSCCQGESATIEYRSRLAFLALLWSEKRQDVYTIARRCFVVGRSIIHGRAIDNVALLRRAADPHGFAVEGIGERRILFYYKKFNLAQGKIEREHLIDFGVQRDP